MSEKCEWLAIRVRPKVPRAHRRRVCSANGRRSGAAGHPSRVTSTLSSVGFDLVSGRSRRRGVKIGGSLFLRFSASGRLRTATTASQSDCRGYLSRVNPKIVLGPKPAGNENSSGYYRSSAWGGFGPTGCRGNPMPLGTRADTSLKKNGFVRNRQPAGAAGTPTESLLDE